MSARLDGPFLEPPGPAAAGGGAQVVVEVLHLEGCPHTGETVELVRSVARRVLPGAEVRATRLDQSGARRPDFLGSPTVLVNGRDAAGREPVPSGVIA